MTEKREDSFGPAGKKRTDYDPGFANEVYAKVDQGEALKTCIQCGVCAATCPLSAHMDFSPRRIFTMIRAGKREEVLGSKEIMLCTSCYGCKVRCPRQVPVMDIMHGLAHYAIKQGYKNRPETIKFGKAFWDSIYKLGRIDETIVPVKFMMADGIGPGIKKMMGFQKMGLNLMFHKRMKLLPTGSIKGVKSLRKMLDKAGQMKAKSGGAV